MGAISWCATAGDWSVQLATVYNAAAGNQVFLICKLMDFLDQLL